MVWAAYLGISRVPIPPWPRVVTWQPMALFTSAGLSLPFDCPHGHRPSMQGHIFRSLRRTMIGLVQKAVHLVSSTERCLRSAFFFFFDRLRMLFEIASVCCRGLVLLAIFFSSFYRIPFAHTKYHIAIGSIIFSRPSCAPDSIITDEAYKTDQGFCSPSPVSAGYLSTTVLTLHLTRIWRHMQMSTARTRNPDGSSPLLGMACTEELVKWQMEF